MTDLIPFEAFGGDGPPLHFAHANAYTPGCYRQLLAPLAKRYRVLAMAQRALWSGSPPTGADLWRLAADDLLRFLDQQGLETVIGVGHSLGAVATMLAALRQPARFRALALIEPVFLPPHVLQAAVDAPAAVEQAPFVRVARRRRNRWPDRAAAFAHFREKAVFARFSDAALWDYVQYGLREEGDGAVALAYPREWEAYFYARPPLMVWEEVARIPQPTLALRGAESDTLFPSAWALWQERQPGATFVELAEVGHLAPLERPLPVAQLILDFLDMDRP